MVQEGRKILLIDDSMFSVCAIKKVIESKSSFPVEVLYRPTMETAISFLEDESGNVDLILLDLGLPDTCSDEESFTTISEAFPYIPIVVLTGRHDHCFANNIIMRGAQDYVNKDDVSANSGILINAIDFAISRHCNQQKVNAKLEQNEQVISWISGEYSVTKAS